MSSKSWLAIDVGTAPTLRAQELRFAWERFVAGLGHPGPDEDGDPDDRARGDRRLLAALGRGRRRSDGRTNSRRSSPTRTRRSERWQEHPLARAAPLIHECLSAIADEAGYLDRRHRRRRHAADDRGQRAPCAARAADDMNFAEGTLWSEGGAGTNAIGTAIAADHAVQVFGPEHFNEAVQRWTCSRRADPRPRHRRAARRHRPHRRPRAPSTRTASPSPPRPRRPSRRGSGSSCRSATLRLRARYGDRVAGAGLARARDAAGPADHRDPAQLGRPRAPRDPARRRSPDPAVGRRRGRRAGRPAARGLRRARGGELAARGRTRRPLVKLALLGRDRALLDIDGRRTELRPRLAEILALLCAHRRA